MSTPIDRLFEAHLTDADLEASIAFYRDRLGLELAHVIPARVLTAAASPGINECCRARPDCLG